MHIKLINIASHCKYNKITYQNGAKLYGVRLCDVREAALYLNTQRKLKKIHTKKGLPFDFEEPIAMEFVKIDKKI